MKFLQLILSFTDCQVLNIYFFEYESIVNKNVLEYVDHYIVGLICFMHHSFSTNIFYIHRKKMEYVDPWIWR